MNDGALDDVSLNSFAETVLPFRDATYIARFCEKLLGEGVVAPADLLGTSKKALETKLAMHAAFSYAEMADTISLRSAIERARRAQGSSNFQVPPAGDSVETPRRRQQQRSRSGGASRHRHGSRSPSGRLGGGRRGARKNSRPRRGGHDRPESSGPARGPQHQRHQRQQNGKKKPPIWAAVEEGDEAAVRQLLEEGCDHEEKHNGWSPLMKAAEEGHVDIMQRLLDRGADMEVANRKGRTALSFAAAPSMKRPTAVGTLRLLLEHGADAAGKDDEGLTPKARAVIEKRAEAIVVFEEFEQKGSAAKP